MSDTKGKPNETLYKVLNVDGSCYHGGQGKWHLPKNGKPGKWMPKIVGELSSCVNGYHVLHADQLIYWIALVAVFTVETRGDEIWESQKGVTRQARLIKRMDTWTEQSARLFACDCAEHLRENLDQSELADFDACLLTIRRYAFGMANEDELEKARAGAWVGAGAGAWARAWVGAGAGAWVGAWAGGWASKGELAWDTQRLFEYLNGQVDLEAIRKSVTP